MIKLMGMNIDLSGFELKKFNINNFSDLYLALGQLMILNMDLEEKYKLLASFLNLNCQYQEAPIGSVNSMLRKSKLISNETFKNLKLVISYRNSLIHHHIVHENENNGEIDLKNIEYKLNLAYFLFNEAIDLINNLYNRKNEDKVKISEIPTIFNVRKFKNILKEKELFIYD